MANKRVLEFRKNVTEMFVDGLKKDGLAWKQGWDSESLLPSNANTGALYKGINRLNLILSAKNRGYSDNRWLTFKQIKDEGYHLEKGSKGVNVEYWFPYDMKNKETVTWQRYNEYLKAGREANEFSLLFKLYTVFNGDNIKGLPEREEYINKDVNPDKIIKEISMNMNVPIIHEKDEFSAYYNPSKDEIHLPIPERFFSEDEYNATALHELAHSTGHKDRLNRNIGMKGSKEYAYEELVAEITSVFMSAYTGIKVADVDIDNHSAYVNSWIKELEESPDILAKAIKEAEQASDYMERYIGISKELSKEVEQASFFNGNNKEIKVGDVIKINDYEFWLIKNIKEYSDQYTPSRILYGFDAYWDEDLEKFKYSNTESLKDNSYEILDKKEYEKILLNKESNMLQSFNDRFYKFGVMLTSENEVKALNHEGKWITWFSKDGKCMGNTDQLNIWLSDRGNSYYPGNENFLMPTCEDAMNMVKSIAEIYTISITASQIGKVIDLEDLSELSFNNVSEKTSEMFKNNDIKLHENKTLDKLKEIFNGTDEKEKNVKRYLNRQEEIEI